MKTSSHHQQSTTKENHRFLAEYRLVIAFLLGGFLLLTALPVFAKVSAPKVKRTGNDGVVTVNWDAVSTAAGYRLLYGPSSGVYGEPLDVGATLSYSLTNLREGQNWYFAVQSYDAGGAAGERSTEAKLSAGGNIACASVSLVWDPSTSPGVTGYRLYYGPKSGSYYTPLDVGNRSSYTVPGLNGCLTWYFAVAAYDQHDNRSDYSNEVIKTAVETPKTPATDTDNGSGKSTGPPGSATPEATPEAIPTATPPGGEKTTGMDSGATDTSSFSAVDGSSEVAIPGNLVAGTEAWPTNGGWLTFMSGSIGGVPELVPDSVIQLDWPEYNTVSGESRVATGDLDGDGRNEIVVGFGPVVGSPTLPNGYFQVLDDDGSLIAWGQVGWPEYNLANGETWPSTADIDGDGIDEIIIGLGPGGYGGLEVFSLEDGEVVHRSWLVLDWPEYAGANGTVRPAGADLDGDGVDEVVAGLGPIADDPDLPRGIYEVFHHDGSHSWGQVDWKDYTDTNGEVFPAAGDLDNDGNDEIVLGLGDGGAGYVEIQRYQPLDGEMPVHNAWLEIPGQDELPEYRGATHPAVGNLDGDSEAEIAVALGTGGDSWVHLYDQEIHTTGVQLWPMLRDSGYQNDAGGSWITIQDR